MPNQTAMTSNANPASAQINHSPPRERPMMNATTPSSSRFPRPFPTPSSLALFQSFVRSRFLPNRIILTSFRLSSYQETSRPPPDPRPAVWHVSPSWPNVLNRPTVYPDAPVSELKSRTRNNVGRTTSRDRYPNILRKLRITLVKRTRF